MSKMKNKTDLSLDRDQQILSRLAQIQHKVDSLEQTTAFALRADSEKHLRSVMKIFGKSTTRAKVYLAINGERNVTEVAAFLKIKPQNVSREVKQLKEEGLIEITASLGNGDIYRKSPLDRTLQITKKLVAEFGVTKDGLLP